MCPVSELCSLRPTAPPGGNDLLKAGSLVSERCSPYPTAPPGGNDLLKECSVPLNSLIVLPFSGLFNRPPLHPLLHLCRCHLQSKSGTQPASSLCIGEVFHATGLSRGGGGGVEITEAQGAKQSRPPDLFCLELFVVLSFRLLALLFVLFPQLELLIMMSDNSTQQPVTGRPGQRMLQPICCGAESVA